MIKKIETKMLRNQLENILYKMTSKNIWKTGKTGKSLICGGGTAYQMFQSALYAWKKTNYTAEIIFQIIKNLLYVILKNNNTKLFHMMVYFFNIPQLQYEAIYMDFIEENNIQVLQNKKIFDNIFLFLQKK